jgi:lysophospholipase L1-like esterase
MTQSGPAEPEALKAQNSRRRDWLLLPALGLLTICLMAVSAELLSRWFYPVTQVGFQNCFATNDPTGDAAVKPNSVCWEQTAESTLKAEYRFNSRGHRAGGELNPKPPDTYRIVLIGSSLTQGLFVPREETFAALLPEELSKETGRKVEVYNEATGGQFRGGSFPTENSAQHFDQVLAAQPDMILWVITPTDIMNAGSKENADSANTGALREDSQLATGSANPRNFWDKIEASITKGTFGERLRSRWEDTRTSIVLKHLLIASESQNQYIASYLKNGDNANFLKSEPDAKWQMQLQSFDTELAEIVGQTKNAEVPLVAVFVPNRPQAAMLSNGDWPAGYDPFKVKDEVRDSIVSHGGLFIDILPNYRLVPNPERDYFPVDGHPNADGHAIISRFLAKELSSGAVPALRAAGQFQNDTAQGR